MASSLFGKKSLEKLSSPKELQEQLVILSFKYWVALATLGVLFFCAILWGFLGKVPILSIGKAIVFDANKIEGTKNAQESPYIFGVMPFSTGEQIREGMKVKVALASIDVKKYGYLLGVVDEVFPYFLSFEQSPLHQLSSKELIAFLFPPQQPFVMIKIRPTPNPHTFTGYEWSTKQGPPFPIIEGSVGTVAVILEEAKPLSFFLPVLR